MPVRYVDNGLRDCNCSLEGWGPEQQTSPHPAVILLPTGQADQADLLHKGSRAEGWPQGVAQKPDLVNVHISLVFLTVSYLQKLVLPLETN